MACQVVFENGEITKVYSPNGQESNLYNQILSHYQGNKEKALEKWVQLISQKDTLRLEQLDSNGEPIVTDDLYLAEDISPIINFYKNEGDKSYSDSKAVFNRVLSRLKAEYPLLSSRIRGRKVISGGGYVYKFGLDNSNLMYQLNTPIKEGVEELFDNNPELANQVYGALGFEIPTTKLQGKQFEYGEPRFFDVVEELTSGERASLPSSILINKLLKGEYLPEIKESQIILGLSEAGMWRPNIKKIEASGENKSTLAKKIGHELLHSVTNNIILSYQNLKGTVDFTDKDYKDFIKQGYIKPVDLSKSQIEALDNLVRIRNKVVSYIEQNKDKIQKQDRGFGTYDYFIRTNYTESETDLHEFISEVFTNPELINILKEIPTEGKKSNLFKDFVDAIAKILGFTNTSILEDIIAYSEEAFFQQPQITPQQKQQAQQLYSQYLEQGGSKQDIEGFKKWKQDNNYQQKSSIETRPSDEKLNKKIATLLEGIGVKTDYLKDSRYKDSSPLGIADMLNKVAYISMNRAKIDTLPEEAAHFFVDYLEQTSNPLFSSMMYDIGKYNTYMETYKEYQNTYLTNDGTPDINKIKKEAIGKMIAKIIVDKNNINESQNLIDRFVRWLNKVMDLIKEQLVRLGLSDEAKIEDYFELAATNILAGKYQGEFKPYDEIFLQQSDTQKKLDNIITKRNSEIRTVKKTDEEESIKEIFEKGEWKRIKRVSDITKTKGKYYTNVDTRTDIEKAKNKNQAIFGEKVHNDLMILMNKALGKTDNRPFMLNSAYHEKMQNFVDSIISQFNPDTHQYYTEVNIHNKNLAGTIDLLIVDSEGKANLFDYKSITGLLNGTNITKNYTDKWYEQLIQYRKILTNYGITNFGQTRVIPIAVNFSDKITAKEGTDVPSAFSIGTNTYIDIDELSNLNPVPLPEERTGNKNIDSMIDRINDRIRQLNTKPSQENTYKINELKKDIANLQVSKNLEVVVYQAETDLGIIENLLKKAESESLNGDEIYDLIQLYNYYEDRLESGLYKNADGQVLSEIIAVTAYVQENKEKIDELLKLYNNTLDVTDETIKPSSWWNRIYKLSDYDIPAFQGLYKLFNRVAAQKEIKIRKLKEDVKDIITQIKSESGIEGEKMFYPILQKDKDGKPNGKLIAQKDKSWFDFVTANKSSLYKNMDTTDISYIKSTPLGQYIKFDEFKTWFDAKMKDKLDSLRTSNDAYKAQAIRNYKGFLINVTLLNPNGKYYNTTTDNFSKFLNPDYKTHIADKPNSGLAKLYKKYVELNQYANENANAGINTNFLPYIRKNTIKNLVDSGFNLRKLKDNVLNDLQSQEWETFELDSNGNKIYKIPLKFNIDVKKRDLEQQSLDLGEMLVLWADSVYNNKLLQDQHDTSLLFLEGLRRNKEYVTKNGKLFTKNGEFATKPVEAETIDQYVEYHNDIFYGQTSKDEDSEVFGMSRRKLARAATQYFSGTQLALNIFSGLSNLTGGFVNAYTYAGNQYTKKDYSTGLKSIFSKDSKVYAAIKMFDVDSNIYDSNQFKDVSVDKINKLFTWDRVYTLQKKGDWLMQNATLVAMMQNYTIKDDVIVKKTDGDKSLIELLEIDDKGKYSLPIRNEEELFRFREKVRNVNSQIIGNTSEYDKQLAGNTLIGQLALQFRRWMLPMGVSRFGSLKYNSGLEEMSYGKYRSTGKLLWETTVKEMTLKPLLEFIKNTKGGKLDEWLLSKYNEDLVLNSKLGTFDEYRDLYFRNMKSTIMEASVLIGIIGLQAGLKGDDDEESWKKVLTRVLSRTVAENSFWFNPDSFFQVVQSPIPIINFAKNVTDILTLPKDAFAAIVGGEDEALDKYDLKFGKLVIGYNAWLTFLKEIDNG